MDKATTPNSALLRALDLAFASSPPVTVADSADPDLPIIYANAAFSNLTGYANADIVGRNCRFLQGEGTNARVIDRIRATVRGTQSGAFLVLNYHQDGAPFYNLLYLSRLQFARKDLVFGFQYALNRMAYKAVLNEIDLDADDALQKIHASGSEAMVEYVTTIQMRAQAMLSKADAILLTADLTDPRL